MHHAWMAVDSGQRRSHGKKKSMGSSSKIAQKISNTYTKTESSTGL
jgi:hypothetical protein